MRNAFFHTETFQSGCGQHDGIIPQDLWDAVQRKLADNRANVGYQDADESSGGADEYRPLLETVTSLLDAYFNRQKTVVAPPPLLTGRDLIDQFGLEEGPAIGRLLTALQEAQATGEVTNREQAEGWIRHEIGESEIRD